MCIAVILHNKIPSYFDGISAAMNILPCLLDVDDVESPDCNALAKSFGQFDVTTYRRLLPTVLTEAREAWFETSQSFREQWIRLLSCHFRKYCTDLKKKLVL